MAARCGKAVTGWGGLEVPRSLQQAVAPDIPAAASGSCLVGPCPSGLISATECLSGASMFFQENLRVT